MCGAAIFPASWIYWQEIDMADINKPQDAKQPISQALAGKVAQDNARTVADTAADAAVRRGADAAYQGGRAAGEALRHNAEVGADVARRGSEAGAEAMRRAGDAANDTARRGAQAVVESQRRIAQDAAERFEEVSRKVADAARGTTENMRRLMALPNAAEGGLRDMQQGVAGLVEGTVRTNLRAAQELFRLANPAPFVELQQRFAREYTDTMLRNGATLIRAMRRTADETLRPLEQQIEQQQRGAANENRGPSRFQTAAE
jgi:hypothetical protein